MDEIIAEFQSESKTLIGQLLEILEGIEDGTYPYKRLEEYGQLIDRIMGTAKSLAVVSEELKEPFEAIGTYGELCKVVSYRASQIVGNDSLCAIVVGLLLDATEMLSEMVDKLSVQLNVKGFMSSTFLDRVRWVSSQFGSDLRGTLQSGLPQNEIDNLLKALGV
ncbi:MAG: hypothetical protein NDI61_05235 [Bdellovibrionaceae bacterium]|nr:hypothetical protein [Pseudobdellovibrionaceae bacterium]